MSESVDKSIMNARISELIARIKINKEQALSEFWKQIESEGTPIFEEILGDDDYNLITFIVRADQDVVNISCYSMFVNEDIREGQLNRIADTDVFFKSYKIQKGIRETYFLSKNNPLEPKDPVENIFKYPDLLFLDPYNPKISLWKVNEMEFLCNEIESPYARPQPWYGYRKDINHGEVKGFRSYSKNLHNEREILIYTPPNYSKNHPPYHFVLLFDGLLFEEIAKVSSTFDNLIAEEKIPPLVAILVENFLSKNIAIRAKELPPNPKFISYIIRELLPWVRKNYNITNNPSKSIIAGASYGGLTSSYIAFKHSEIFGNVISMSGGYFWYPGAEIWRKRIVEFEDIEKWWTEEDEKKEEWLTGQFSQYERLPLKFYIDVGVLEETDPYNSVVFNPIRNFKAMLQTKGYPHLYVEYLGGHDYVCWRGSIADGLIYLVGL